MISFVFAGAVVGGYAGWWGRVLLRSSRRAVLPRTGPPCFGACEVAVAILWALVALRVHAHDVPWWWVALLLATAWWAVLLSACDLVAYRLPDCLTLPAYPVVAMVVCVAAESLDRPELVGGAVMGSVVYAGTYATVRLWSPDSLGPGDVKLSGALGACSGAVSPWGTVACMAMTSMLALGTALWFTVRWRRREVPHGPAMLAPVWGLLLVS